MLYVGTLQIEALQNHVKQKLFFVQDILDKINDNPCTYFFKPIDNVNDFPNKVVIGLEKLLESPFDENNKP